MDVKSMIQEKILVEAKFSKKPTCAVVFFVCAIVVCISVVVLLIAQLSGQYIPWEAYVGLGFFAFVMFICGFSSASESTDRGYELYVTSYRVIGKTTSGLVSVPLESILSVETKRVEKGVAVALVIKTASTSVSFPYIENLNLVYAYLSNLTANKKQRWRI